MLQARKFYRRRSRRGRVEAQPLPTRVSGCPGFGIALNNLANLFRDTGRYALENAGRVAGPTALSGRYGRHGPKSSPEEDVAEIETLWLDYLSELVSGGASASPRRSCGSAAWAAL